MSLFPGEWCSEPHRTEAGERSWDHSSADCFCPGFRSQTLVSGPLPPHPSSKDIKLLLAQTPRCLSSCWCPQSCHTSFPEIWLFGPTVGQAEGRFLHDPSYDFQGSVGGSAWCASLGPTGMLNNSCAGDLIHPRGVSLYQLAPH